MNRLSVLLAAGCMGAIAAGTATSAYAWTNQQSADAMEILNLLGRYTYALDTANPDAYAGVYTQDGSFKAGKMVEAGRDHLRQYVVDLRKRWGLPDDGKVHWGRTRHLFSNFHVEVDGDTAKGGTYWQTLIADPKSGSWKVLATGTSMETYAKVNGSWYIKTREVMGDPKPQQTVTPASAD